MFSHTALLPTILWIGQEEKGGVGMGGEAREVNIYDNTLPVMK